MQTIEFELAKWFKERGVGQDSSIFYMIDEDEDGYIHKLSTGELYLFSDGPDWMELIDPYKKPHGHTVGTGIKVIEKWSAFTLCEILDMLPTFLSDNRLLISCKSVADYCFFYDGLVGTRSDEFRHKNPAQAAGLLLQWCIENGHVKFDNNGAG